MAGVALGAFDTVGVYDVDDAPYNNNVEQSAVFKAGVDATYVIDLPTFQDLLAGAYPLDAGGVINAEAPGVLEEDGSILAMYGQNLSKSLQILPEPGKAYGTGGTGSGARQPISGETRFSYVDQHLIVNIGQLLGDPGEVVTAFGLTVVDRDRSACTPGGCETTATATFSAGGTVTSASIMFDGTVSNDQDSFFGFVAPQGQSITRVELSMPQWSHYDDLAFITSANEPAEARKPNPADGAEDVPRDGMLSWVPGKFAGTHNVYFGETFEDVNAATTAAAPGLDVNSFDPGRLNFGKTYFWRVDEVNATPDKTVFKGDVWRFEVEPIAIPVENVTATASGSNDPEMGPEKTIDGSGLDALDQHSTLAGDMWLSAAGAEAWIQYEFPRVYKLHEMWVWNSNQMVESFVGLGAKDVTIEISQDGAAWTVLEDAAEFAQAPGKATYTANTVVDFGAAMARFLRITINAGWGAVMPQSGLSEVRFFYIPVQAREPQPEDGASTDGAQVVLTWRSGRDAALHEVSLGTDSAAMTVVGTTDVPSLDAGALDYGTTYFWKVDEVNLAETPAVHAGHVWSFTTPPYGIVDDFDQYDDNCNRIFFAWADGLGHNGGTEIAGCEVPASNGNGGGSIVGNATAPFAEKTIVNSGSSQSMPFEYDNAIGASETSLTLNGQDWTASGVQTLSLAFYGTDGNTGILYVKVNNSKVSYDLDPADIARSNWQAWNIDLTGLGGLQNVTSLTIGVDGANAAGMLYIDDIRLYPQAGELITPAEPDNADA